MEFYHIHTLGACDNLWKVNKEFVVDDNFNNRLYSRLANFKTTVPVKNYPSEVKAINRSLEACGYAPIKREISIDDLLGYCMNVNVNSENFLKIINDAKKIIYYERFNNRERALEEYRKNNCPNLPSRLHSLFVTDGDCLPHWEFNLANENYDIYLVDVFEKPFVSNEQLFPKEGLSYLETYKAAAKYWNAKIKKGTEVANECLVRGRVRIVEKVAERRFSK